MSNQKYEGKNLHRLESNPKEAAFAKEWANWNSASYVLEYIMGEGNKPATLSNRDILVASSVIQWLGSPVGQSFLREAQTTKP